MEAFDIANSSNLKYLDRILSIFAIILASIALTPDVFNMWKRYLPVNQAVKISHISVHSSELFSLSNSSQLTNLIPYIYGNFHVANASNRSITLTTVGCNTKIQREGLFENTNIKNISFMYDTCERGKVEASLNGKTVDFPLMLLPGAVLVVKFKLDIPTSSPIRKLFYGFAKNNMNLNFADFLVSLAEQCGLSRYDEEAISTKDLPCLKRPENEDGYYMRVLFEQVVSHKNIPLLHEYLELTIDTAEGSLKPIIYSIDFETDPKLIIQVDTPTSYAKP